MAPGQEIEYPVRICEPSEPLLAGNGGTARGGVGARRAFDESRPLLRRGETREMTHASEAASDLIKEIVNASDRESTTVYRVPKGGMILVEPGMPFRLAIVAEAAELVGGPCPTNPLFEGMVGA